VLRVILSVFLIAGSKTQAVDIFATPTPRDTTSIPYPTLDSFLSASKSGDIPLLLISEHGAGDKARCIERSIGAILANQYGVTTEGFRWDTLFSSTLLFLNISEYEIEGPDTQNGKWAAAAFQDNRKRLIEQKIPSKALEALDALTKEYSKAVKAYVIQKHDNEEQAKASAEKVKQQSEAMERQAQASQEEKTRKVKAAEDARKASVAAEETTKAKAIQRARAAQQEERAKQLADCLESPSYKLWQVSLEVEAGVQMIRKAQGILNHDNAVARESNVTDLAERRSAGEEIVAGKRLVATAFADYKKLGGTASTPEEVVPGPDPAAQYR